MKNSSNSFDTTPEVQTNDEVVQDGDVGVDDDDSDGAGGASSSGGPMIKVNVWCHHEVYVPAQSTFRDLKKLVARKTGLEPEDQRLFFRGEEKDDEDHLHVEGVKEKAKILLLENQASKERKLEKIKKNKEMEKSKILLLEDQASKERKLEEIKKNKEMEKSKILLLEDQASEERKLEEIKKNEEMLKASEAVAGVRSEVDELSERVAALEVAVNGGTKVSEEEFLMLTELLMRQLLNLDSIEAEGEAKLQRKSEVHRVQNFVDTVDSLKFRNSNPLSNSGNAVPETTNWESFDSGIGSLNASPPASSSSSSSSTNVTLHWEQLD